MKANAVVRATTRRPSIRERVWISSSLIPSPRYSLSGSALRLAKGSTTIAGAREAAGAQPDPAGAARERSSIAANSAALANR
ncbi:MAG TPA: hypothetical protein VFU46_03150 [Gemmatimonadales bacterium]|nr:hypothetical protein [Gemmatimonadales bacterium]